MRLSLLPEAQLGAFLQAALGGATAPERVAAELLRHEVLARGGIARHSLLSRVVRLAAPAMPLEVDAVEAVFDALEREGDVLLADGARVYPAPLVAVTLGHGAYRVVCTLPSAKLINAIPGEWNTDGVRRECRTAMDPGACVLALGGVVVSPETWAGLDRAPIANAGWLSSLNDRLTWSPESAGSLDGDDPLDWSAFVVADDQARWRRGGASQLWRARHRWRRWVHAWTGGESPLNHSFVSLPPDEASRSAFAIARDANVPYVGSLRTEGQHAILTPSAWFPRAEFRYMSTCAEAVTTDDGKTAWRIPAERVNQVVSVLEGRLGALQLTGAGPA